MLVAGAIAGEVTARPMNTLSLQADLAIIEALTKAVPSSSPRPTRSPSATAN